MVIKMTETHLYVIKSFAHEIQAYVETFLNIRVIDLLILFIGNCDHWFDLAIGVIFVDIWISLVINTVFNKLGVGQK